MAPEANIKDFDDLKVLLQSVEKRAQVYLREGHRVQSTRNSDSEKLE